MREFLTSVAGKVVLGAVLLLIVIVAFKSCSGNRQAAEQGKQDAREGAAATETAKDAANTITGRVDADKGIDDTVGQAKEDIGNAKDSHDSGDAARDAICKLSDDCK